MLLVGVVFPAAPDECRISEQSFLLGDRKILVREHLCGDGGVTIFNMHDDEDTAVEASLEVIRKHGGRLVEICHTGERLISFNLRGELFQVDPNRIFTDQGIRATLERYGRCSPSAFAAVREFAVRLLEDFQLLSTDMIITAHNNGPNAYSAESYLDGAIYEHDASRVRVFDGSDPDDFFFVTDLAVFTVLEAKGFNVVLQDNQRVTDDGSLSVLAGRKGIPYINCEAEHGHYSQQVRMLEALLEDD